MSKSVEIGNISGEKSRVFKKFGKIWQRASKVIDSSDKALYNKTEDGYFGIDFGLDPARDASNERKGDGNMERITWKVIQLITKIKAGEEDAKKELSISLTTW